jgi:hypothetical protein
MDKAVCVSLPCAQGALDPRALFWRCVGGLSQGTIEWRVHEVLEKKRQLFNELIEQNGPPPSLGLTEDDAFGLFDIPAPRRRAAA